MREASPRVLVWSSLFPSSGQPQAGIFIRERMFRVGRELPLTVISPQPWFPFQGFIRRFRPHFRPEQPLHERQSGIDVYRPRFLSFPGILKGLDATLMASGALGTVRKLRRDGRVDIIDAHFGYPDGYAAVQVGRKLRIPVTVTMRGTESRHSRDRALAGKLKAALMGATRVFAVSSSLRDLALELGVPQWRTKVVGNGVDVAKFAPLPRPDARQAWRIPESASVLVTVGGLVERKGFHRVIACMPELLATCPNLHYLIVGSPGPEGDYSGQLKRQVVELGLQSRVHFLGALPPEGVCRALSAADVFVLSSRNEGWANVLLEAMACGLPVVASNVGGNAEVVCRPALGTIVPFDEHAALVTALQSALARAWDRNAIRQYAMENEWQSRVNDLVGEFRAIAGESVATPAPRDNAT